MRAWTSLGAAAVVAALTMSRLANAQEPFAGEHAAAAAAAQQELLGATQAEGLMAEPVTGTVAPQYAGYGVDDRYGGYDGDGLAQTRPVNWISGPYLRGGVNFVLGEDLFDVDQKAGYGISGGFRQALGPEIGGDRMFFDLGGSYQDAYGEATPVNVGGRRITTVAGVVVQDVVVPDAFATTLEELRRASVHASIGWYWGSPVDNRGDDPQLRFATRLGGRVGHVRGGYTDALIIAPPAANQTIDPVYYQKTDTYGGLFVGTEAILLQRQFTFGHFQWTVDGEFANDWINIGNIWDGSLGTASVMTGFMLSR